MLKSTEHDTTIFNVKTPEFYINMKPSDIPPRGHSDRQSFVQQELKKCIDGVNINGAFIPGSWYYDLNYHFIELDTEDGRIIGRPRARDNGWIIHNDFYNAQQAKKHYAIMGSRQISKNLPNYVKLRTLGESIPIGDIAIGDKLLGRDGKETEVTGVFPQGVKPIYKLTFSDGRTVDAGLEHRWGMYSGYGKYNVVTTEDMLKDFRFKHKRSGYNYKYYLPEIESINYPEQRLPINPYVLGQLLGNGGLTTGTLTINTADLESIELLKNLLPDYKINPDNHNIKNNLPINKHTIVYTGPPEKYNVNPLKSLIEGLKLNVKSGSKFIPEIYKKSSTEQRLELLAGLYDSDGWIGTNSSIEIKLKSEQLIDDIIEVLRSLGVRCQKGVVNAIGKLQHFPKGRTFISDTNYFRCYVRSNINLFKLKRKADRFFPRSQTVKVAVTNIEYLYDYDSTCISVDNKDKLYLIDNFVPTHNTDSMVSITMREISVFERTTAMQLFSNSEDKVTFSGKMKIAHDNLVDFLKIPLLDKDFNKSFLRFGFKETNNDDELHARLYLLNTDGGKNTEIAAGRSITFLALDEFCKADFKASLDAALPAFRGKFGYRNSAILSATGGNIEKSAEGEKFFMNPEANDLLNINGTGRFLDGTYRADFKKTTTLAEYLRSTGINLKPGSELDTMECDVSDIDEANQILDKESENYLKSGETDSYNKHKIYYPRKISDMFLKENANPFSDLSSELEKLYDFLNTQDYHTQTYEFQEDGDVVKAIPVDRHYDPFSTNLDQPIVIIDHPRDIGSGKLYVAGLDSFNIDKTTTSASRGSFYIMRKPTSDYSDPWQETMVCWYNGRKDLNDLRQKLRLALKYYGADAGAVSLLHEAPDDTMTQWFMDNKIGYWLENTYQLTKQILANTKAACAKGLRPTKNNQNYGLSKLNDYLREELPDGRLGLWRIKDKLVVKQLLKFDGDLGPCFIAGTRITTPCGYKFIENLEVGDYVLTHTGSFQKVLKTYKKIHEGNLYKINRIGSFEDIFCTEEHPFLSSTPTKIFKNKKRKEEKLDLFEDLTWVPAKDLTTKNYVVSVKNKNLEECPLSEPLLYILGWYLSDGYLSKTGRLKITFGIDQFHIAERIKDILESLDEFAPKFYESTHWLTGKKFNTHTPRSKPTIVKIPNKNAYNLECSSVVIEKMIRDYVIIKEGGEKQLKENLINCKNLDMLFLGFYEGDGSLSKNTLGGADRWNLSVSGVYQKMIHQFKYMLTNHGYCVNLYIKRYSERKKYTIDGKLYDFKDQLHLSMQKPSDINRLIEHSLKFKKIENNTYRSSYTVISDLYLYNRVKSINVIQNCNVNVFNIEVENDNSYVANDTVVHNCDAIVGLFHTIIHLYKEKNYAPRLYKREKEELKASEIAAAFNSGFGFNLPKTKGFKRQMI